MWAGREAAHQHDGHKGIFLLMPEGSICSNSRRLLKMEGLSAWSPRHRPPSSTGSQEQRASKGVTFAGDVGRMVRAGPREGEPREW